MMKASPNTADAPKRIITAGAFPSRQAPIIRNVSDARHPSVRTRTRRRDQRSMNTPRKNPQISSGAISTSWTIAASRVRPPESKYQRSTPTLRPASAAVESATALRKARRRPMMSITRSSQRAQNWSVSTVSGAKPILRATCTMTRRTDPTGRALPAVRHAVGFCPQRESPPVEIQHAFVQSSASTTTPTVEPQRVSSGNRRVALCVVIRVTYSASSLCRSRTLVGSSRIAVDPPATTTMCPACLMSDLRC